MKHPAVSRLAQFAGKDLPRLPGFFLRRHLRRCPGCAQYVDGLRVSSLELRREAGSRTLTSFEAIADFDGLEREMRGNITVGLAAARCVEKLESRHPWRNAGLIATGLSALFVAGWWSHIPAEESHAMVGKLQRWAAGETTVSTATGTVMRSLSDGVAVRSQGLTLTMRHPRSAIVSLGGSGVMEARFVDDETGQVTISSVYGQ